MVLQNATISISQRKSKFSLDLSNNQNPPQVPSRGRYVVINSQRLVFILLPKEIIQKNFN